MIFRLLVPLAFLAPAAQAQAVASEAECRLLADQVAFAAEMRDEGHPREDVAPGLSQSGLDDGTVAVILDWAFAGPAYPPQDLAESFFQQCLGGFR